MADYDVQALGLASPPASAPVTTYYPGVTVRNNGVHPANVTGYVRQYDRDTGLLLATYDVARANLAAGATAAVASTSPLVLLPADIGRKFLFQGFVTCDRDSVPANNYFGPVEVVVTGETPPPPPIDEHHTQHENGGADELNLDGLPGKLAENQEPTEHASAHQDGGADQLDVDGLSGELAEPQTAKSHAGTHSTGGADPIIGYEETSHRGAASGYAPLDSDARLPIANLTPTATRVHYALPSPVGPTSCPATTVTNILNTSPTAPADGDLLIMLADVFVKWPAGDTSNLEAQARFSITDGAGTTAGPWQELRLASAGLVLNEPYFSLSPMLIHQLTGSITNILIQVSNPTATDIEATVRSYVLLNTQKP